MSKRCHKEFKCHIMVSAVLLKKPCQLTDSKNKNKIHIFKSNMEFAKNFFFQCTILLINENSVHVQQVFKEHRLNVTYILTK